MVRGSRFTAHPSCLLEFRRPVSNIAKRRARACAAPWPTRTATRSPTRPMRPSLSMTSPQRTETIASGLMSSISVSPTFELHHPPQRQLGLVEHRVDGDLGLADLGGEMVLPDRVAAELLAHEHLQQDAADRLDRRIGQQQFDLAAAILHVDAQPHQDRRVRRPGDGGEARIGLHPVDVELHRRQRLEGQLGVGQHHLDHALDEIGLDRRVGPALDAHRRWIRGGRRAARR